jgi:alkylhydroperoxidase family enzyme
MTCTFCERAAATGERMLRHATNPSAIAAIKDFAANVRAACSHDFAKLVAEARSLPKERLLVPIPLVFDEPSHRFTEEQRAFLCESIDVIALANRLADALEGKGGG